MHRISLHDVTSVRMGPATTREPRDPDAPLFTVRTIVIGTKDGAVELTLFGNMDRDHKDSEAAVLKSSLSALEVRTL